MQSAQERGEERRGDSTQQSASDDWDSIECKKVKRPYNDVALRYHPCLSVKLMKDGN